MKKLLVTIIALGIYSSAFSQDVNFSHLNQSKLFINPGFAGSEKVSNLTLSHRNLSPANFGNYLTYKASYNQYLDIIHGGLGLQFIKDDQGSGAVNRTYISGIYSYRINLQRNLYINPALEVKYATFSLNADDLTFPSMFDERSWDVTGPKPAGEILRSSNYLEFNTGVILRYVNQYLRTYRDFTIGLAVHHLNKPKTLMDEESHIYRRYSLYFDIEIFLNYLKTYQSSTTLIPTFHYTHQLKSGLFHYGTYLKYKHLIIGGLIKHNPSFQFITPTFQVGATFNNFEIGYSYDAGFLNYKRTPIFSGAHEVTFSLNFSIKGV